ncbi:methyltransferase domain-containing protein [Candidatus Uhrbacteria bacterium]|nr:methyltransferase domain-containing protein [Candidatus Uhrbacteria bacterium]
MAIVLEILIPLAALAVCIFYFVVFVFLPGHLPFVPSKRRSVAAIIAAAGDITGKRVLDLGSGDGRIVIACARAGAYVTGYEINPVLVWYAHRRIARAGFSDRAVIRRADFWKQDMSGFDIIIFYGVVYAMPRLEKKLRFELHPGARVIASHCAFPTWKPVAQNGMISVYEQDHPYG